MRAKFYLQSVKPSPGDPSAEVLEFCAVTDMPYDAEGNSEDNSFARWTPSGSLTMTVTNPNLVGTFKAGEKFYLDFTKAE
jgi:hypothetical protein